MSRAHSRASKARWANISKSEKSERMSAVRALGWAKKTPAQRSELMRAIWKNKTPAQRSAIARKIVIARTKSKKRKKAI